jgi:hypothetical protein
VGRRPPRSSRGHAADPPGRLRRGDRGRRLLYVGLARAPTPLAVLGGAARARRRPAGSSRRWRIGRLARAPPGRHRARVRR